MQVRSFSFKVVKNSCPIKFKKVFWTLILEFPFLLTKTLISFWSSFFHNIRNSILVFIIFLWFFIIDSGFFLFIIAFNADFFSLNVNILWTFTMWVLNCDLTKKEIKLLIFTSTVHAPVYVLSEFFRGSKGHNMMPQWLLHKLILFFYI